MHLVKPLVDHQDLLRSIGASSVNPDFFNNIKVAEYKNNKLVLTGDSSERVQFGFYRNFISRFLEANGYDLEVLWQS